MIWKNAKNFEDYYEVSSTGLVRSKNRISVDKSSKYYTVKSKILKPRTNTKGYLQINLSCGGRRTTIEVHKLIAETFLKKENSNFVVDHIDNNKSNNNLSNLQFISSRQNSIKDKKNKTSKYPGVSLSKGESGYVSGIYISGVLVRFGRFTCEEEAYLHYKTALCNKNLFKCRSSFKELIIKMVKSIDTSNMIEGAKKKQS